MKIVISSQYRENYAAHDWDGKGECPKYWKCKGGETYIIANITAENAEKIIKNDIEYLCQLISYSNNYAEEQVTSYGICENNVVTNEPWESVNELKFINNQWISFCITVNDEYSFMNKKIVEKRETYILEKEGKKENYNVEYLLKNGELIHSKDIMNYLS